MGRAVRLQLHPVGGRAGGGGGGQRKMSLERVE